MKLRELQYRIYGDDRLSGKLDKVSRAGRKVDRSLGGASNKMARFKTKMQDASSEIPGLSRGLRLLSNPITLAVGGLALLAVGINKAKNAAADFNTEFRDLNNLNLKKSHLQIAMLRADVLNTAAKFGFDPLKTSKGFYDIQSITGKYGNEVQKIVAKVGMFSRIMRSDFTATIAGTAQAMDIYGLKANQLDDYLTSLNATVQVGKTNFDELTRVQVRYANAAAAIGQSYNNANRLFAVFSKLSDSIDISARYTKIAFQDLTKSATMKGFEKIGVKIFDIHGKMRGVDKIVEDLIPKLKAMSGIQFARFKQSLGSSIGVNALLDMTRNKADRLIASFKEFDNTKFNMSDALKTAMEDVNFLNDTINGKLKVSLIRLGQTILPAWVSIKDEIITMLDAINDRMYRFQRSFYHITFNMKKYNELGNIRIAQMTSRGMEQAKEKYTGTFNQVDWKTINKDKKDSLIKKLQTDMRGYLHPLFLTGSDQQQADQRNVYTGMAKYTNKILWRLQHADNASLAQFFDSQRKVTPASVNPTSPYQAGLAGVSGGGSTVKSVTVQIGSLVKELIIKTTNLTGNSQDIEQKITELLVRSVAGAEQIISSN